VVFCEIKSGLWAALLFITLEFSANAENLIKPQLKYNYEMVVETAHEKKLYKHPTWLALLHVSNEKPQIKDANFLLSLNNFNPEAEMIQTLQRFNTESILDICRFPARYAWLSNELNFENKVSVATDCPEIKEFIEKAPFDQLELIFADETVTQPASILGHSFLKISGKKNEKITSHAIAFYTDAGGANLPKLLWESVITGKKGLFSLTPYEIEQEKYLRTEQRNLWSYKIKTSAIDRELIRNHLFELKQVELTYFFHAYNCATLLRNILSLTGKIPDSKELWVTPKDVLKDANSANLIGGVSVDLADSWLMVNLEESVENIDDIKNWFTRSNNSKKNLLSNTLFQSIESRLLSIAYNRWLFKEGLIDRKIFDINESFLNDQGNETDKKNVRVRNELNPIFSRPDSALDFQFKEGRILSFTPTSHALMDDQAGAVAETELQLLSPSVSFDSKDKIRLEELKIFSMKSLRPRSQLLGGWASTAYVGYGPLSSAIEDVSQFNSHFQFGLTKRIIASLDWFGLLGGGLHQPDLNYALFTKMDTGVIFRHGSQNKSTIIFTNWLGSQIQMSQLKIDQSWYISPVTAIRLGWISLKNENQVNQTFEIGLRRLF
jgi:Domain of unknown function (DUF4105)